MKLLRLLVVFLVLVAGATAVFVYVPFGPGHETFVEIAPGTGSAGIARQLEQAGVVRSRYAFEAYRLWVQATGHAGTLKAGEYRFAQAASLPAVYDRLRRGDVYTVAIVIPEGYNLFDIAQEVGRAGFLNVTGEQFLAAAKSQRDLIRPWSPAAPSLEGYLFPDTYKFDRHARASQMLAAMVKRFDQAAAKLGLNGEDVARTVTLASLVEREVHFDDERADVASVFENRLAAGMPLQTDPAVAYASQLRGTWTGVIHQSELHSDSAYNTYTHTGLPPGPICNPGFAALKAAMHPAQTNYLYFVADANGRSKFASTLREHNANVATYRAAMPQQ